MDPANNGNLGRYGPEKVYNELLPKISLEKIKLTPGYLRRKEIVRRRLQRKRLSVFDRNISIEDLYEQWTGKKKVVVENEGIMTVKEKNMKEKEIKMHRSDGQEEKDGDGGKDVAKLVLPPLHVSVAKHRDLPGRSKSVSEGLNEEDTKTNEGKGSPCSLEPSIFVTSPPGSLPAA